MGTRAANLFVEATELLNSGDFEGFLERFDPEMEFTPDPQWPEQGPFVGRDAWEPFLRDWQGTWGEAALDVEELEQRTDDFVIARCRWRVSGAASGADVGVAVTFLAWFGADGRVTRLVAFFDHPEALRFADSV